MDLRLFQHCSRFAVRSLLNVTDQRVEAFTDIAHTYSTIPTFDLFIPSIIAVGIFDKDVSERTVMALPELYVEGRKNVYLTIALVIKQILFSIVNAALIFFVSLYSAVDNAEVVGNLLCVFFSLNVDGS